MHVLFFFFEIEPMGAIFHDTEDNPPKISANMFELPFYIDRLALVQSECIHLEMRYLR